MSEKILTKRFEIPGYRGTLEEYEATGGYQAIAKALKEHTPASLIDLVRRSGLRGRGARVSLPASSGGLCLRVRSCPSISSVMPMRASLGHSRIGN